MPRFLIDEDLPRSLAPALREAGFDTQDVRDVGLRGCSDVEVFARAQAEKRVLLSADLGFANALAFPAGSHAGIAVARLPNEMPVVDVTLTILKALRDLADEELAGAIVIVELHRTRIHRHPSVETFDS